MMIARRNPVRGRRDAAAMYEMRRCLRCQLRILATETRRHAISSIRLDFRRAKYRISSARFWQARYSRQALLPPKSLTLIAAQQNALHDDAARSWRIS